MDERRVHQRLAIDLDGRFRLVPAGKDQFTATVVNVSYTGLQFCAPVDLAPGTLVEMEVDLDPSTEVTLQLAAVWSKPADGSPESEEDSVYCVGACINDGDDKENERFRHFFSLKLLYPPKDL
jgi:hypothetical protein